MMMLGMQVLVVLGIGMVIYAIFEIFKPQKNSPVKKKKSEKQLPSIEDPNKEQKIQGLQQRIVELENESGKNKTQFAQEKAEIVTAKENELKFSDELKRREEWVARAESELAKLKGENSDLSNKFIVKEKELGEEFAKNVNLTREVRAIKAVLEAKEMACRLKEDQLQAQKHQIESQLKSIDEHLATIAEFNRKEKISEWVPKQEFNKLNEEYTKLEKDLEASQERLKSFAVEIAHLRQLIDKKAPPAEEIKLLGAIPEEIKQEGTRLEETKAVEEIKVVEENMEKKIKEEEK